MQFRAHKLSGRTKRTAPTTHKDALAELRRLRERGRIAAATTGLAFCRTRRGEFALGEDAAAEVRHGGDNYLFILLLLFCSFLLAI
jgi:hypothetical protein